MVKNQPSLSEHDLNVYVGDGLAMVVVLDDVLEDTPLWEYFLVGCFLSTTPHVANIHVIGNKISPLTKK